MKIAVVGTVGVPARYGGFETLAEQLAKNIDAADHQLVLYGQRSAYSDEERRGTFNGHQRVFLLLRANGLASLFHDMMAMVHAAVVARVDTMLVLGYSGCWFLPIIRLLRPGISVVTNIDGMEWRRNKFGRGTRILLRTLEWFAIRFSHRIVADNEGIVTFARQIYQIEPQLIAYGGDHTVAAAREFGNFGENYALSVARIEPENNCHMILEACAASDTRLIFVGNWEASAYGQNLRSEFGAVPNLTLYDPVYEVEKLAHLRMHARLYIHGHSIGGTNPSLVEAIFHHDRIIAFDCIFNRATLLNAGSYFRDAGELEILMSEPTSGEIGASDLGMLRKKYVWSLVCRQYLDVFENLGTPATA